MAMLPVTPLKRRACEAPASSCKERKRELPRDNLSGLLNLFRCSRRHQSQLQLVAKEPRILLVVGECGDGKSTLVNALRDPDRSGEAESGLCSRGVTKEITAFVGREIDGHCIDLLDTPGVGDQDVTPMAVLTLIERELISYDVQNMDAVDGILVTTPIPDGRTKLGAQLVKLLVEHGFVGDGKWRSVILVGTKSDRATQQEIDFFKSDIVSDFFASAPGGKGSFALTSKNDYSSLRRAIAALPSSKVKYCTPEPTEMAWHFADKLGIDKSVFEKQLLESRDAVEAELSSQFAAREAAMKAEIDRLSTAQADQARAASLENIKLQSELEHKLAEKDDLIEQSRLAAPADLAAIQEKLEQAQKEIRSTQRANDEKQQMWKQQLDSKERDLKSLLRKVEAKEIEIARSRNYNFGSSSRTTTGCLHPSTRNWGNASGRGRKCTTCRAELGR